MAYNQPRRKVVVTGIGVVTALGQTLDEFWSKTHSNTNLVESKNSSLLIKDL